MKIVFIVLFILIAAFIALLFNYQKISNAFETPNLVNGKLSKCPDKPNCVCSEYKDDSSHYIDPIIIPENSTIDYSTALKEIIREMGGEIQTEQSNYITATFTSSLFKFVDDLEIKIDSNKNEIHIRSASRVGHSDMSVNKKRSESIKELLKLKVN